MTGGVLYEHGHRLWASWVGILTIALLVAVFWGRKHDRTAKRLAVAALILVCFQGTLGGITVKLNLSSAVSTLHLGTAMVFFALLISLTVRLAPGVGEREDLGAPRGFVLAVTAAVLAQIALGGLTRHLGAGLICGDDWLGCGPSSAWTKQPLAHLHMTHRLVAYALVPIVAVVSRRVARDAKRRGLTLAAKLAWLPTLIVVAQVALGLITVATGRSVSVVTLHTAFAALLFGSLWATYVALGPEGARFRRRA